MTMAKIKNITEINTAMEMVSLLANEVEHPLLEYVMTIITSSDGEFIAFDDAIFYLESFKWETSIEEKAPASLNCSDDLIYFFPYEMQIKDIIYHLAAGVDNPPETNESWGIFKDEDIPF